MNPLSIKIRSLARKLGLITLLKKILPERSYEAKFNGALLGAISHGDTVWDVGANVGFYTKQFAELVGSSGKVFAFEPSPGAANQVAVIAECYDVIELVEGALSEQPGEALFDISSGGNSVTNHISAEVDSDVAKSIRIDVHSGDSFADVNGVPAVVKIDVEGFEVEVIRGMKRMLESEDLKGVFCEIHFGNLESRGLRDAPLEIEQRLVAAGFTVKWVDPSHIAATRR